jgi:hypothetical protein
VRYSATPLTAFALFNGSSSFRCLVPRRIKIVVVAVGPLLLRDDERDIYWSGLIAVSYAIAIRICLTFFLFSLIGCARRPPQVVIPDPGVHPGDCLLIVFVNPPEVPQLHRVIDPAGDITMPYDVKVHVAGMALEEAAGQIEKAYRRFPEGDLLAKFKVLVSKCK